MVRTDRLDVDSLRLRTGEGRRLELLVAQEGLELGGERYAVEPAEVEVTLDISRMVGGGLGMRLRFGARVSGPCMRCLEAAAVDVAIDVREVDVADGGEELESPYVEGGALAVRRWVHDAVALALPTPLLCEAVCLGLCPICAVRLSAAGPDHRHDAAPDPRWEALRRLRLE
jgi:uncharacterized protein